MSRVGRTLLIVLAALVVLQGCASPAAPRHALEGASSQAVDLSGSWELDYGLSDNAATKLESLVRELQREAERRAQGKPYEGQGGALLIGNSGRNSGPSLWGQARMAEFITQSQLLLVEQSAHKIKVEREEDYALTCEFHAGQLHSVETPFGTEACGWNAHQLVFKLLLPDGLAIQHVLTLGAAGQKLNIATTVVSDQVSMPFTLNRVYNRFVPGQSGFNCTVTLTKGKVCTTESPP